MPSKLNGILWVTRGELLQAGVNKDALRTFIRRNRPKTLKKGVYALHDLPAHYQEAIRKTFNIEECQEYTAPAAAAAEAKYALIQNWKDYLHLYQGADNAELWAKSASCFCNFVASIGNMATLPAIRTQYCKYLSVVQKNNLVLPHNERVLQRKIKEYLVGTPIQKLVCPPRQGNTNAQKYPQSLFAYVLSLRANPNNYTDRHIWRKTKEYAQKNNLKQPSLSWVKNLLKEGYVKMLTATRWDKEIGGFVPLKKDINSGEVWQIDGTRVNFIPHSHNGEKKSLYIIAVLDVFSRCIIGYTLCHAESYENVANALHNAIQNTKTVPKKLITDRFPGHTTEECKTLFEKLKTLGVEIHKTHKATGKSHIERAFGVLQTVFMQDVPVYYGEGIQSTRPYAHKSETALKKITKITKKEYSYDFTTAQQIMDNVVYHYNHTPLSEYSEQKIEQSPYTIYQQNLPNTLYPIQLHHIAWLFWEKRTLKVRENLIEYHKKYEEHYFFIYDTAVLKKVSGKEVEVYTNDEVVYIYQGSQYIGMAERQESVSMNDYQAINNVKNNKKTLQNELQNELKSLIEQVEEVDESLLLMPKTTPKHEKEAQENRFLTKNMLEDPYDYI